MLKELEAVPKVLLLSLLAVSCMFAGRLSENEMEEMAESKAKRLLQQKIDTLLLDVARSLKYDWPVVPPTFSYTEHYNHAKKQVQELAMREFPDSKMMEAMKEADERFRPLKVGEKVKLTSKPPMNKVYEGRIQAFNQDFIRIGNSGQVSTRDLDDETLDRFNPERNEARKKLFLSKRKEKLDFDRQMYMQDNLPVLLGAALLADGYVPIDADGGSKGYHAEANWQAKSAVFEAEALKQKAELEKELLSQTTKEVFRENGYDFDASVQRWRLLSPVSTLPLEGQVELHRSWWEKRAGK